METIAKMEVRDNIIHRPDISNKFDDMPSIGHMMIKNLTDAGSRIMLVDVVTGEEFSAIEIVNRSIEVAKGLLAVGLKKGDVVSIVSENRVEFAFVMFGTIFNNCIIAPVNNTYSASEISHALNLSKPKIIFVSKTLSKKVVKIAKTLSFVKKVVSLDNEVPTDNIIVQLRDFLNPRKLASVHFKPQAVNKVKTCCFIMCSSGTTGLPKGVQISQNGLIVTTRHTEKTLLCDANVGTGERVVLGLLPFFHVFGAAILTCSMAGAQSKIILLPKFEEKSFLSSIQDYRCTVAFVVPPLMVFMSKNEIVDNYDLSSLRLLLCGAAPLSKETEQAVRDRLKNPHLLIKQGYGMTELTVGVTNQKSIIKPGSVGDVNPGVSAKVIDENGTALGPNQRGELCFKGSVVMLGYINNEEATNDMIDKEGWLHTGDVGYYDEDLQIFLVDRIKELIKWKGFQVPPAG